MEIFFLSLPHRECVFPIHFLAPILPSAKRDELKVVVATDACVSDLLFLVPLPFSEAGHQSLSPSPFRPLLSSFFPGHFISISALAPLAPPQGKGEGKVSSLSSFSLAGSWPPRGDPRLSIPLCSLFAPPTRFL